MTLHDFVDATYRYGTLTGASVTSWGRTAEHNAKVGGVPFSAHRFWVGLDVVYDDLHPVESTRVEIARRLGLTLIPEGDHDHLQPLDWSKG